ncbi:MAG: hypothetical protein AAGK00_04230 [Pseudomonadota bacterium]
MVRTYHYFLTIALLLAGFALTAAASEDEAGIGVALLSDFCLVAGFVGVAWLLDKALWRLLTEDR